MDDSPERDAVKAALLNIPELSKLSGLSSHTIRSVLARRRKLRAPTRRKLAAALRAHSSRLAILADQLESPASR